MERKRERESKQTDKYSTTTLLLHSAVAMVQGLASEWF